LKILLTGGLGFTGLHLQRAIATRGHEQILLQSDITNQQAMRDELEDLHFDSVIHLAAVSHVAMGEALDYYRVNVLGTSRLLATLSQRKRKPGQVLIASSANIYGNALSSPITESTPPAPVNDYAASKLAMECLAKNWSSEFRLVITRPFNYTGKGQSTNFLIPKLVDHFKRKAQTIKLGNLNVAREYNNVEMVCAAYLDLLEAPIGNGIFNVCSGQAHALADVIKTLQEITGHQIQIESDPALIRPNEVKSLCGNPEKLNLALAATGRIIRPTPLPSLLETMLAD
jgi:GDP-6-deoxy-D-talose 4-dehydrogenase